ncbi:MAG: hypothetical protein M3Q49_06645 [Actinomycetota bacterium]|nr:hypothetical protein [Actinomycetota bacterium]MDP9485457.1 hypothetical protein [Actinomycetota bacterium]
MAKLTSRGYDLLPPNRYGLEVVVAEPANEYGPQIKVKVTIIDGEYAGSEFTDFPNCGVEGGVKIGTKAWDIFEACLGRHISPDEELDTDDLIGKRFEAMVVVKKTGKGNRIEHGTVGPHRLRKPVPQGETKPEEPREPVEDDFADLPF